MGIFKPERAVRDTKIGAIVLLIIAAAQVNEVQVYVAMALIVVAVIVEPGRRFEPPVRFKRKGG